mgnify:CR=1 FL=1
MGRLAPGIVGARTWRGHRRKRTERMHQDHGGHDPFQRHGPHGRVKKGGASILTDAQHVVAGMCASGHEASVWVCLLLDAAAGAADG